MFWSQIAQTLSKTLSRKIRSSILPVHYGAILGVMACKSIAWRGSTQKGDGGDWAWLSLQGLRNWSRIRPGKFDFEQE